MFTHLSTEYALRFVDVIEYFFMLIPFEVDHFELRAFGLLTSILQTSNLSEALRMESFFKVNRIIARVLLIKKSKYLDSKSLLWPVIVKTLNQNFRNTR